MLPATQPAGWVCGHHASRPHILQDTGFRLGGSGCDLSRRRLPDRKAGRQACRWAHTRASCAAAGAQASCSNPSDSDQQDGPAQAEGSLQGGTLLQTEAGAPGGERQEELPGLLSWRSSSGFRAGSDRRPFSHSPPHTPTPTQGLSGPRYYHYVCCRLALGIPEGTIR